MNVNLSIIPECFADTNLVETITNSFQGFNHQKNCNKVAYTMQTKFSDSFAVGIIDKDKKTVSYLDEFGQIVDFQDLYLFKHPGRHHYIIQIFPAIERFILKSAEEVGIDLASFNLPNDFETFKRITKRQTSKRNPDLRNLFIELKNRNAPQIVTLSKWITYLKENTYLANTEELVNN